MTRKLLSALMLVGVLGAVDAAAQTIPDNVTFRNYFGTMTFNRPLQFLQYPGEDSTHIVVQQNGRIITVQREGNAWVKTDSALITVTGGTSGGDERGLLGFAFHPQFTTNGKYYLHYISGSNTMIVQRTATGADKRPRTSDAQATVLQLAQPQGNHNGGSILFGPADGYLYIALGDGGGANDPQNYAQNLNSLLGKILRVDVDGADGFPADPLKNYAIPTDNPFATSGGLPEIWAYGLRNPYRAAFHPLTQHLWIGDVGQNQWEEISRVPEAGANLGWRIREGAYCFNPSTNCQSDGLVPPARTMQRSHAASITGGAFFTGDPTSAYHNVYVFGDYVTNHVWAMRPAGGQLTDSIRIGQVYNVVSFDRDAHGRVFATSLSNSSSVGSNNGVVFVLESPDMVSLPVGIRGDARAPGVRLRPTDVARNPAAYEFRGLDGRLLTVAGNGTYWVRAKGARVEPQLMTVVR